MIVVSFAVTLVFAIGSWHLIEKRALAFKPDAADRKMSHF
jgi:peptidoglycan/LPS O-acetylase OafA/YrhL